ncbi:MAG: stress responsive protein [Blastopirellula sp.]|nr:MAG: stress responsive protein [Blastopirellula sp.]
MVVFATSKEKTVDSPIVVPTENVAAAEATGKKLRHVVLFKFKETATAKDIKAIEDAFRALPSKIPSIKDFEWGINNSPEKHDKGFTHCFLLTFDSEAGRDAYLPHPAHKAFGKVLGPHMEDVHVIDYWAGE